MNKAIVVRKQTNMENKNVVSSAIKELEKEKQEKEIAKIKDIVRAILEKIEQKDKEVKAKSEEFKALKADLDDLKAGRLDKIQEKQGKDPVHDRVTLIWVTPVPEQFIPYQPWRSPWVVEWAGNLPTGVYLSGTSSTNTLHCTTTGTLWQNFSTGTYTLGNGNIINL